MKLLSLGAVLFTGALAVGALRPTNTWDFPAYLILSLAWHYLRQFPVEEGSGRILEGYSLCLSTSGSTYCRAGDSGRVIHAALPTLYLLVWSRI